MAKKKILITIVLSFMFLTTINAKEIEVYKLSEYELEDEAKVQVNMVDSSGKPIKGAKLKILDSSKKPVIEWES